MINTTPRHLWDGREYIKIHKAMDVNGNGVGKVFFTNGTTEIIKDSRLPIVSDKFYKSLSGLYRSR